LIQQYWDQQKRPKNTQEGQLLFLVHKYLFRA
jgi:hypothetical protein